MSLRNRQIKKQLTTSEIEALQELNMKKTQFQNTGMTPDQITRAMAAEETVFAVKGGSTGRQVSDNFTKVSDLDPSQGVAVLNPVKGRPELIIGADNRLYNMDGSVHPATLRMMKKFGL